MMSSIYTSHMWQHPAYGIVLNLFLELLDVLDIGIAITTIEAAIDAYQRSLIEATSNSNGAQGASIGAVVEIEEGIY